MHYLLLLGSLGCAYNKINDSIYTIIIFAPFLLWYVLCMYTNIANLVYIICAKNIHFVSIYVQYTYIQVYSYIVHAKLAMYGSGKYLQCSALAGW